MDTMNPLQPTRWFPSQILLQVQFQSIKHMYSINITYLHQSKHPDNCLSHNCLILGIASVSSTADLYDIQRDSNQLPFTNDTETNSETKNTVKTSLIHSNSLVSKLELARTNN